MLSASLWQHTKAQHHAAERSGFIAMMLRGTASRQGYTLFLRNLLPCYQVLEAGLDRLAGQGGAGRLALPEVARAAAIEADLLRLGGRDLPVLPEAAAHAARIREVACGDGARLIGHAYTRTLGDLSGGQILQRLLGERMGLEDDALAFYRFPAIDDIDGFKAGYRAAIDIAGTEIGDPGAVLEEAVCAFRHTIALSDAVAAWDFS
jgi:heme oxygenase